MTAPDWTPAEYDYVAIPAEIAARHGVEARGTIVDIPVGAKAATVECTRLGGRRGLDTALVDLPFEALTPTAY
jgi:hypothetical protein